MMRSRRAPSGLERSAPSGLSVDLLGLEGDEFAVFAWDAPAPAPPAAGALTRAERDVLRLVLEGASNEAIARARVTSARTVARSGA
ncbi:MAG TPA: LuxR C-terminal-related transcriptional regulator [Polyangiaceae bacterium]|nr:LuxR C-terminal-related transcriptional regulator [Polyangiaceae bacterium]